MPAVASYADAAQARSAPAGVKTLFMVSAAEAEDRLQQHHTFVDAAAEAAGAHRLDTFARPGRRAGIDGARTAA